MIKWEEEEEFLFIDQEERSNKSHEAYEDQQRVMGKIRLRYLEEEEEEFDLEEFLKANEMDDDA